MSDYRLRPNEPYQISATAWNRAQDAADVVFGTGAGIRPIGGDSSLTYVTARINRALYDQQMALWPQSPEPRKLQVGHAVELNQIDTNGPTLYGAIRLNTFRSPLSSTTKSDPVDLVTIQTSGYALDTVSPTPRGFSDVFGIIAEMTDPETTTGDINLKLIIGGTFVCRAWNFGNGNRLTGPAPLPDNTFGKPYEIWEPYPVVSVGGVGVVYGFGNFYSPIDFNEGLNPRLQEVLVRL